MDAILQSLPIYMIIGIVIIIGISQFKRTLGAILGIIFWIAVAIIGSVAYDKGGAIGLPGIEFPQWAFLLMCAVFVGIHAFGAWVSHRRKQYSHQQQMLDEYDND